MSEPELPGIPPAPEPPKPAWYKRLFARRKLPAWAFFVLSAIEQIPDWKGRLDFWMESAREADGYLGVAAIMIASPYFSVGLVAAGVAWLLFVGEPQKGVQRHAWLPYLGWGLFAVCLTAVVVTAGWGAIQFYIREKIAISSQSQFWYLSDIQKKNLGAVLDSVPPDQRFPIVFEEVFGNAQALTMANDLGEVFVDHGWKITGSQSTTLRPDLQGINFVIELSFPRRDKDQPPHGIELWRIFNQAGIKTSAVWLPGFKNDSLVLAIGSRPPYW